MTVIELQQREQEYKHFVGQWAQVVYGTVNYITDYGKISSVDNGFLRLNPYIRNLSTELTVCVEKHDGVLPIHISDVKRIIQVSEKFIDDVVDAITRSNEFHVKQRREELGIDRKVAGLSKS